MGLQIVENFEKRGRKEDWNTDDTELHKASTFEITSAVTSYLIPESRFPHMENGNKKNNPPHKVIMRFHKIRNIKSLIPKKKKKKSHSTNSKYTSIWAS